MWDVKLIQESEPVIPLFLSVSDRTVFFMKTEMTTGMHALGWNGPYTSAVLS